MAGGKELLSRAQRMLDGPPSVRAEAILLLHQVAKEFSGTSYASEAWTLLNQADRSSTDRPSEERWSVGTQRMRERLRRIHKLDQPQLIELLRDFSLQPFVMDALRSRVVEKIADLLSKWIEGANAALAAGGEPSPPISEVETLIELIPHSVKQADMAIRPLGEYRLLKHKFRLRGARKAVAAARMSWQTDEALRLLEDLGHLPPEMEAPVGELWKAYRDIVADRDALDALLGEASRIRPDRWLDLTAASEMLQKFRSLERQPQPPQPWRARAEEQAVKLVTFIEAFLRHKATEVRMLSGVAEFCRQLRDSGLDLHESRFEPRVDWFEVAWAAHEAETRRRAAQARDPNGLEEVARELRARTRNQPAFIQDLLEEQAQAFEHAAEEWRRMLAGKEFDPLPLDGWAVPEAFREQCAQYREYLRQIEEAGRQIDSTIGTDPTPRAILDDVLGLAKEILDQRPDHKQALQLKDRALKLREAFFYDQALRRLDVDGFMRQCGQRPPKIYADLAKHREHLERLTALAQQIGFDDSDGAATWWDSWLAAKRAVEPCTPPSLRRALEEHEEIAIKEWDRLVREQLTARTPPDPENLLRMAETIRMRSAHRYLGEQVVALQQRAYIALLEAYLERHAWYSARKPADGGAAREVLEKCRGYLDQLRDLGEDDPGFVRARMLFEVRQAEMQGLDSIVELLDDRFYLVRSLGNEVHELVLVAVEEAWEKREAGHLDRLVIVVNAMLTDQVPLGVKAKLEEWTAWIRLEKSLRQNPARTAVVEFGKYLDRLRADVQGRGSSGGGVADHRVRRLRRLWEEWKEMKNLQEQAWAGRALRAVDPRLVPGADDPASPLAEQSNALAERARSDLRSRKTIEAEDLEAWRSQLSQEIDVWKNSNGNLDLLPFATESLSVPVELERAARTVQQIGKILEGLRDIQSVDLREDRHRYQLELLAGQLREPDLEEMEFSPEATAVVDRWRALTKLNRDGYIAGRIHKLLAKCRETPEAVAEQPKVFNELFHSLETMVQEFKATKAVGKPMWRLVSEEYCQEVYRDAGIRADLITPPDLAELVSVVQSLDQEHQRFLDAAKRLWEIRPPHMPVGAEFSPEAYPGLLKEFPQTPPRSRITWLLFKQTLAREPYIDILRQARDLLPAWLYEDLLGAAS